MLLPVERDSSGKGHDGAEKDDTGAAEPETGKAPEDHSQIDHGEDAKDEVSIRHGKHLAK